MFNLHARPVAVQRKEHGLLIAVLVKYPLDYDLIGLLNTAGIFIQYSECKQNTVRT